MGAVEFLHETALDSYQVGVLDSVVTCSDTLFDTLNLVLEYTKLGATSQYTLPDVVEPLACPLDASKASVMACQPSDIALLIEEATETVVTGHFFDNPAGTTHLQGVKGQGYGESRSKGAWNSDLNQDIKVVLSNAVHNHWSVQTQPGAIRRIIMNLLGNSLKYTLSGNVSIPLELGHQCDESQLDFFIRVEDTGIGMSHEFQRDLLPTPFRQENRFEPGVGLGLSVTKRIVDSLQGTMVINSKQRKGTSIDISLSLPVRPIPYAGVPNDLRQVVSCVKGKHLVLLDVRCSDPSYQTADSTLKRENALCSIVVNWFGMQVPKTALLNAEDADLLLYSEPPSLQE